MLGNIQRSKFIRNYYSTLKVVALISVGVSLIALLAIILFVFINGFSNLSFDFLFSYYSSNNLSILPALLGTIYLILISVPIASLVGIFTAIFLSEYTKKSSRIVNIIHLAVETLAGIPSVIYGLFGYLVFVVGLGLGYSLIGGGITLAIMILPVIVRSTEESLKNVPNELREGSFALGTSKIETIFKVVLPCAMGGIITSIILAIGRVLCESAVLMLTIGMVVNKIPLTPLSAGTSLALDIYYFANYGYPNEAAATALVLLVLVLLINLLAYFLGLKFSKRGINYENE